MLRRQDNDLTSWPGFFIHETVRFCEPTLIRTRNLLDKNPGSTFLLDHNLTDIRQLRISKKEALANSNRPHGEDAFCSFPIQYCGDRCFVHAVCLQVYANIQAPSGKLISQLTGYRARVYSVQNGVELMVVN